MSIASMTGFARVNGSLAFDNQHISWIWEIKSVNGKNLDIKMRLPVGYDDMGFTLKTKAAEYLNRGSVSVNLEIEQEQKSKKVRIDEELLQALAEQVFALADKYGDRLAKPSASDLLGQRGVVELEESVLNVEDETVLRKKIAKDFEKVCQDLQADRKKEGEKIKKALQDILAQIENTVARIEKVAVKLPERLEEKLAAQLLQYVGDTHISEDRIAQEVVMLVTKADIREEIDRLKAHIKSAYQLLDKKEAVGRRLDFLCQELNREANTTCSKSADIVITNMGMDLKALIEQFREQVQNIE